MHLAPDSPGGQRGPNAHVACSTHAGGSTNTRPRGEMDITLGYGPRIARSSRAEGTGVIVQLGGHHNGIVEIRGRRPVAPQRRSTMGSATEKAIQELARVLPRILEELQIIAEEIHRLRVSEDVRNGRSPR